MVVRPCQGEIPTLVELQPIPAYAEGFYGRGIQALSVSDGISCYAPELSKRSPFGKLERSICERESDSTRPLL